MPEDVREPIPLWLFSHDSLTMSEFDRYLARDSDLGVQNDSEWRAELWKLKAELGIASPGDVALPDDFPRPRLHLPDTGFAPDFFKFGSFSFASGRFRTAVNQPAEVVQFAPVDLVAGGVAARAQDYRLVRVLARQPAMDMERSDYTPSDTVDPITRRPQRKATWVNRYVFLDDLRPATEIFRIDETYATILVTDALAERVMLAGCSGMEFVDPALAQFGTRLCRFRTAKGTGERKIGFGGKCC